MLKQFVLTLSLLSATECSAADDIVDSGMLVYPIPVSPVWKESRRDAYDRTPVLPPLPPGGPTVPVKPPSRQEILRCLQEAQASLKEASIDELSSRIKHMNVERISRKVTPPRMLPLVGLAEIATIKFKCTVCLRTTDSERDGAPAKFKTHVTYIEHTHLHMVVDDAKQDESGK